MSVDGGILNWALYVRCDVFSWKVAHWLLLPEIEADKIDFGERKDELTMDYKRKKTFLFTLALR